MTDYVNRQVESSTPSDQQQRRHDGQKVDDDVAQKEGDGWLSEDAVDCHCLRMICSIPSSIYWGALSCIHRRTVMQRLNYTRSGTSSKWGSVCNRRDRPRSYFFVLLTRRAAALSTVLVAVCLSRTSAHQLVYCITVVDARRDERMHTCLDRLGVSWSSDTPELTKPEKARRTNHGDMLI